MTHPVDLYDGKKFIGSFGTIQKAVDAASDGDTIKLSAGIFEEAVTVNKVVSFEGSGVGQTVMDGLNINGGSGLHLIGDLGSKEKIEISGITFQNYTAAGVDFDDDAVLKELKIEDSSFIANELNGVRIGGDYDPVALEKIQIKNSSFDGNGNGSSNGDGDILLFQYYGDAKIENVTINGSGTADNAIQIRGDDGPIGKIEIKNVSIDGAYAKTGIAVYNYSDGSGLKFKDVEVNALTGWGKPVNVDGVGGKVEAKKLDASAAPGVVWVQGDDGDNDLKAGNSSTFLNGKGGDDKLKGGDANDFLIGGSGDDTLRGGDGNDWLEGGAGADYLNGGKETPQDGNPSAADAASYGSSGMAVTVSLEDGTGIGGDAEGDILVNIENIFGSQYSDDLTGSSDNNLIFGFDGDDEIYGLGGDDYLEGGQGGDFLDGGSGNDYLSYSNSNIGVNVNLETGHASGGEAQGDTFQNFENLNGSLGDDTLTGDDGNNWINGQAGNDILDGRGGADNFFFEVGDGNDTILNFEAGISGGDTINITMFGFDNFDHMKASAIEEDGDVVIDLGETDSLTLVGLQIADLHSDDFFV